INRLTRIDGGLTKTPPIQQIFSLAAEGLLQPGEKRQRVRSQQFGRSRQPLANNACELIGQHACSCSQVQHLINGRCSRLSSEAGQYHATSHSDSAWKAAALFHHHPRGIASSAPYPITRLACKSASAYPRADNTAQQHASRRVCRRVCA